MKSLRHIPVVIDKTIPRGQVEVREGDKIVARIVNLFTTTTPTFFKGKQDA